MEDKIHPVPCEINDCGTWFFKMNDLPFIEEVEMIYLEEIHAHALMSGKEIKFKRIQASSKLPYKVIYFEKQDTHLPIEFTAEISFNMRGFYGVTYQGCMHEEFRTLEEAKECCKRMAALMFYGEREGKTITFIGWLNKFN